MERLTAKFQGEHEAAIEAVRVGTIIAHDRKSYQRYTSMKARQQPRADDAALERQIQSLAGMFPGHVEHVVAPA